MSVLQKSGDEYSVFDPDSPNYMGSRETVQPFRVPLHQQIKNNGGVGPAQPALIF